MKTKISIAIDSKKIYAIEKLIETGKFRNRSHAIEFAVFELLKNLNERKNGENEN